VAEKTMVYGRYNYSSWGLSWFINQQTSLGGPILYSIRMYKKKNKNWNIEKLVTMWD